jgi:hypothetical protein
MGSFLLPGIFAHSIFIANFLSLVYFHYLINCVMAASEAAKKPLDLRVSESRILRFVSSVEVQNVRADKKN